MDGRHPLTPAPSPHEEPPPAKAPETQKTPDQCWSGVPWCYYVKSGGVLLSHKVPLAVPSALRGLASGFGI